MVAGAVPAAAPPSAAAAATTTALGDLSARLGALDTQPTLDTRLPGTGQSVSDVVGIGQLLGSSLGATAAGFKTGDLTDLVQELNGSDVDGLGVSAALTTTGTGSRITLTLGGSTKNGKLYLLDAQDRLVLDGTSASAGAVEVKGSLAGTLTLDVTSGDKPVVTLSPTSTLAVSLKGTTSTLSVPARYGFSSVTATGTGSYDVGVDLALRDPDQTGGITQAEWSQTSPADLATSKVRSGSQASLALKLDSSLVSGAENGTLTSTLGTAALAPTANGDGSYSFPDPTLSVGTGLGDFGKVSGDDAVVAVGQTAAAYAGAQSRIDVPLPLLGGSLSSLAAPVKPLTSFVESQGAAAVACGRADTNPPGLATAPGTTWYCQARTSSPVVAGSVSWKIASGSGSISGNGTEDTTAAPRPTANVAVTGSATEPDVAVTFKVKQKDVQGSVDKGDGDKTVEFTAQRRVRTAQELATRLSALGGSTATASYSDSTRALSYAFTLSGNPAAQSVPITVDDQLRNRARLRGVKTDDKLSVDVGATRLAGTFGLLLGQANAGENQPPVDRGFLVVDPDAHELSVAGITTSGGSSFTGTGSVGYLSVDVQGTGLSLSSQGLDADIDVAGSLPTSGSALPHAALLSAIGGTSSSTTGRVRLQAAADVAVSSSLLPSGDYSSSLRYTLDQDTPTTTLSPLPTVTPNAAWKTWVSALDTVPQVSGRTSSADADGQRITDADASFLHGDFGHQVDAGTVLGASVINQRTGGTCSTVRVVSDTTLECVRQDGQTDGKPSYAAGSLSGGRVADPDGLATPGTTDDDYRDDNSWDAGDIYVINGAPTAMKGTLLGGLVAVADAISQTKDSSWRNPLPLVGLAPVQMVPQTTSLRNLATTVSALVDDPDKKTTAPADLAALEKEIADRLDAAAVSLGGSADDTDADVSVKSVDDTPTVVLSLTLPAQKKDLLPLAADLRSAGVGYALRTAKKDGGKNGGVEGTWSSLVTVDIGVPIGLDAPARPVQVLPGTGVTKLHVTGSSNDIDLTSALGPAEVQMGSAAAPHGVMTLPDTAGTEQRTAGTVVLSGTNTGTGTTLTDAGVDLGKLAGATTTAKRGGDGKTCNAATASGSSLVCTLTDSAWASGDAYTVAATSDTVLTDTVSDLAAAKVEKGDLVVATQAGKTGVCTVDSVTTHQLVCTTALSNGAQFVSGDQPTTYRVIKKDVLVAAGSTFDASLVGLTLTNTTDGSTCTIAAADGAVLRCESPLTGGTDNRFEPGDEYAVEVGSSFRADLTYALTSTKENAGVEEWAAALTGTLTGEEQTCGTGDAAVKGIACAVLPTSTVPDKAGASTYLGTVTIAIGQDGKTTAMVGDGVKGLSAGTTPLGLGIVGDATSDLGSSVGALVADSLGDQRLPLLGDDATAGSWLQPVLDRLGAELRTRLTASGAAALASDATVFDGDTNRLQKAVQDALSGAADAMVEDDGKGGSVDMVDVLDDSLTVTVLCDEGSGPQACSKDALVGQVQEIRLAVKIGKQATYQVPFDSGLPGLGVSSQSLVNADVDWALDLEVGVSRDLGGFVDVKDSKLTLTSHATMPDPTERDKACPAAAGNGLFGANGPFKDYDPKRCQVMTFGLLQATAYDGKGEDRSHGDLDLSVGLDQVDTGGADEVSGTSLASKVRAGRGLDGVSATGSGAENFYFVTGISPGTAGGGSGLPSVHGTMKVTYDTDGDDVRDADATAWTIDYGKIYLDAGTFVSQFAGPVFTKVSGWVKPFKPLIDVIRAPIPGLSQLADLVGAERPSLLTLAKAAAAKKKIDLSFIDKALGIIVMADTLGSQGGNGTHLLIPLGRGGSVGGKPADSIVEDGEGGSFTVSPKEAEKDVCGAKASYSSRSGAVGVGASGTSPSPAATKKPKQPTCVTEEATPGGYTHEKVVVTGTCPASGCTGKETTRTLTRSLGSSYSGTALTFPFLSDPSEIFGMLLGQDARLVHLDLGKLTLSAEAAIKWNFMAGPVPVELGVSLGAEASARLALGYDTLGLRTALAGGAESFDPGALVDGFYVDDFQDGEDVPEIELVLTVKIEGSVSIKIFKAGVYGGVSLTIAADLQDPNNDGRLRLKEIRSYADRPQCLFGLTGTLEFFLGVFLEIDLWIKTIRKEWEVYRSPKIKLFELKCEPRTPVLAATVDGNLELNSGPRAALRNLSSDEPNERFRVRQVSATTKDGTRVSVEAFGETQEFTVPKDGRVVAHGGDGNDVFDFQGGNGKDGTSYDDFTVPVTVYGDGGNDTVNAGTAADQVFGGAGNDQLSLDQGNDTADGGDGNDTIGGGFGDDTIDAGADDDNVTGDAGADTVDGQGGDDSIAGGPGLSQAQYDALPTPKNGKNPAVVDKADTLVGGSGSDNLSGHVGNDKLYGDTLVTGDFRSAACADDAGGGGADDRDTLDGEAGDDWLAGGGGADTLGGSAGNDTLCGNAGDDVLNGDTVGSGDPAGNDELRGGSGDDVMSGLAGSEYALGGPGDDTIDTGSGTAVALGGTGSDAITTAEGNDIVLGDTGSVTGVTLGSAAGTGPLGDATVTDGADLVSRVSGADAGGTTGSLASCTDRSSLTASGLVDLDGDGSIGAGDTGKLAGLSVVSGGIDVDRDGSVDDADNGAVNGVPVTAGKVSTASGRSLRAVGTIPGATTGDADCLLTFVGNDLVLGGAGGDRGDAGDGTDLLRGGAGGDTLRGSAGTDRLEGEDGDDALLGDAGQDLLLGGTGDDLASGGFDDDTVQGNQGDDHLVGGTGTDRLVGGSTTAGTADGGDLVEGGEGTDRVVGDNGTIGTDGKVTLFDVAYAGAPAPDGSSGNDTIRGDGEVDRLFGQGGDDVIDGGAADDQISGGAGEDTITGGEGTDEITGGSGLADAPAVQAGALDGGDRILGGGTGSPIHDRTDVILGDNGTITRPGSRDLNTGIDARDVLLYDLDVAGDQATPGAGVSGGDVIDGGGNRDLVFGQGGDDVLLGGIGDDWLEGNAGNDRVDGQGGDDDAIGGSSSDVRTVKGLGLVGKPGAGLFPATPDKLSDGADEVSGGDGNDAVLGDNGCVLRPTSVTSGSSSVLSNGCDTAVKWSYQRYQGNDLLNRVVKVASSAEPAGAFGNDVLHGDTGHDEVYGGLGDDTAEGGSGDDVLVGDLARVVTSVSTAAAKKYSVPGFTDQTVGGPGTLRRDTTLYPDPGTPAGTRTGGDDVLLGGLGNDAIHGGSGDDTVWGNRYLVGRTPTLEPTPAATVNDADALFGDHGNDRLWGGWGRDHLFGGYGNDRLDVVTDRSGDPTADRVGADLMYGGWGADGMQADSGTADGGDKMIDTVGAYNGFFCAAGASVRKTLDSATQQLLQGVATADGAVSAGSSYSSGWWEVNLVLPADTRFNSSPAYGLGSEQPRC